MVLSFLKNIRKSNKMKNLNYYWPLITALIFYSIYSILWGSTGLNAVHEMEARKKMLENNLAELSNINQQLNEDLISLSSDPERIAIQSRNLGYIQGREKMLFVNLSGLSSSQLDVGKILHLDNVEGSSGLGIKWLTFIIFSAGQILIYLLKRKKRPAV